MISNTPETEFLLQPELLAIKNGLEYKEDVKGGNIRRGKSYSYRGYFNADGLREGVGISTYDNGNIISAEYHN